MQPQLDFVLEEKSQRGGVSVAIFFSIALHALFLTYILLNYHPVSEGDRPTAMVRYVELIKQNPRTFTEAPGPKAKAAPLDAPFSDANRRASTPRPTGENPTTRPGEGGFYTPPTPPAGRQGQRAEQAAAAEAELSRPSATTTPAAADPNGTTFTYRPPSQKQAPAINWNNAIREVGKVASLGNGQQGVDLGQAGGEKGFAESGPLSFESQWYDWGDYAESMVSRIRVNWYNNMPQLIQTGLKGVVTIRFTIHRDGEITDIIILRGSGIPPYDFAAKKALELSSPLNPLPKDFPNPTERVTAMFFYNEQPPSR